MRLLRFAVASTALLTLAPAASAEPCWQPMGCLLRCDGVASPGDPIPADERWSFARGAPIRGDEVSGYVSFTFDDGPNPATTRAILDTLDRFGVPGTFFIVGKRVVGTSSRAQASAELLREIDQRGHEIGNHTMAHENLGRVSKTAAAATIDRTTAVLESLLGRKIFLFRPPYGATSGAVRSLLDQRGLVQVLWSVDSNDYQRRRADTMMDRVFRKIVADGGGVVLFHDTKSWTADALPDLLARLEAENCRRLSAGQEPILPVSLHYFSRGRDETARSIPAAQASRTRKYRIDLAHRCRMGDGRRAEVD